MAWNSSKLKIRIIYKGGGIFLKPKSEKKVKLFGQSIKNIVINSNMVDAWAPPIMTLPKYSPRGVEYVIITRGAYKCAFERLARWKTCKGIPAKVVTLGYIRNNYTGWDTAAKIRNFIKDAADPSSGLQWDAIWFLLAGDPSQNRIPTRITDDFGLDPYHWFDDIASDLYFSDLNRSWDANRNKIYGEVDDRVNMYADVFVGRASVGSLNEAETFVNKVLTYEKNPPPGYIPKLLLPAEELWSGYQGNKINNKIVDLAPDNYDKKKLYESRGNLSAQAVVNKINNGFNLCHYASHGNYNVISTGPDAFYSWDADSLINGNKLGIHIAINCIIGKLDHEDCIVEHFMNNPNGGTVAWIANSRYGWGNPPKLGPSEKLDRQFFRSIFRKNMFKIGMAKSAAIDRFVPNARNNSYWRYCVYELNLFGDPSMVIWTQNPEYLTVTHPLDVVSGVQTFLVKVSETSTGNDVPVPSALVCISKGDEVYEYGVTDSEGKITFIINPATSGKPSVVVTKHNYIPYRYMIGPSIEITSPSDGKVFSNPAITIEGTVDDMRGNLMLVYNGIAIGSVPIIPVGCGGTFSYNLTLVEGENTIYLYAQDPEGDSGVSSTIKVIYSPDIGACWVSDPYNQRVIKLLPGISDAYDDYYIDTQNTHDITIIGFNYPGNLSVNPKTGECWIPEPTTGDVVRLDSDVNDGYDISNPPAIPKHTIIPEFTNPTGLSINPQTGVCWAADFTAHEVAMIYPDAGSPTGYNVKKIGGFSPPFQVSAGVYDNSCWVADIGGDRIIKLIDVDNIPGSYNVGPKGSGDGTYYKEILDFIWPHYVSANINTGECWVSDTYQNQVVKLSVGGDIINRINGFNTPFGISVNRYDGSCWVADSGNNQVVKLKSTIWWGYNIQQHNGEHFTYSANCGAVSVNPDTGNCWVGGYDHITKLSGEPIGGNLQKLVTIHGTGAAFVSVNPGYWDIPPSPVEPGDLIISKYGTAAMPGKEMTYYIQVGNIGDDPVTAIVLVDQLPVEVDFISSDPNMQYVPRPSHVLIGGGGTLGGDETLTVEIKVNVHSGLMPGYKFGDYIVAYPHPTDANIGNNSAGYNSVIVASWDPNDKAVSPQGYIASNQLLSYFIHYENKGNIAAEDILITDILNEKLDDNTLMFVSDNGQYDENTRTITWDLQDVFLPPEGEGVVSFMIRPESGLAIGTEIKDKATIIFDNNPAIDTPEVVSIIGSPDELSLQALIQEMYALRREIQVTNFANQQGFLSKIEAAIEKTEEGLNYLHEQKRNWAIADLNESISRIRALLSLINAQDGKHVTQTKAYDWRTRAENIKSALQAIIESIQSESISKKTEQKGEKDLSTAVSIHNNLINPTLGELTIFNYELEEESNVRIKIYNIQGKLVKVLVDETKLRGEYTAEWDGRDKTGDIVSSSLYLVRIEIGNQISETRNLVVIK